MTTTVAAALAAYAAADCTALAGGALQLLDAGGAVLAAVTLNSPAGTSAAAIATMSGFPKSATGSAGTIASARYRTAGGADYWTGVSVGIPGSGAQVIVDNGAGTLVVAAGQTVTIAAGPTLNHA